MTSPGDVNSGMVPAHQNFCVDCRTWLGVSDCCDAPKHRVVSLSEPRGRTALLEEVWGPASRRHRIRQLTRAGKSGATAGSVGNLFDGCGGCDAGGDLGELFGAIVVILCVVVVFVLIYWLFVKLLELYRRRTARHAARSATLSPPSVLDPLEGLAFGTAGSTLPVSGEAMLASGLEVRTRGLLWGGVTWRDGSTQGFRVDSGDGRMIVVPAGRIRIEDARIGRIGTETIDGALAQIAGLPLRASVEDLELVPGDLAYEVGIRPGDQIAVSGPFSLQPDDTADAGTNYRGGRAVFVPVNVPVVRLLARASESDRARRRPGG